MGRVWLTVRRCERIIVSALGAGYDTQRKRYFVELDQVDPRAFEPWIKKPKRKRCPEPTQITIFDVLERAPSRGDPT